MLVVAPHAAASMPRGPTAVPGDQFAR